MDEVVEVERVDLVRIESAEAFAYVHKELAELASWYSPISSRAARRRSRSLSMSMSHIRVPASILSNLLGDPEPSNEIRELFRRSCFTALRAASHTVSPSGAAYYVAYEWDGGDGRDRTDGAQRTEVCAICAHPSGGPNIPNRRIPCKT